MTEEKDATEEATEEVTTEEEAASGLPATEGQRPQPLSTRIRAVAKNIGDLLDEYLRHRHGYIKIGKEGKQEEVAPTIAISSDPDILIPYEEAPENAETEDKKDEKDVTNFPNPPNPLFQAAIAMGEMTELDAQQQQAITKIGFLLNLGVQPMMNATVLIDWANRLAKEFTYLIELKTTYSEEMKAKYSELLTDINVARGLADQVAKRLAQHKGQITVDSYHDLIGDLLHYASVVQGGALQLADSHDEMTTRGISPLEESPGVEWVKEKEKEVPKIRPQKEPPSEEHPE